MFKNLQDGKKCLHSTEISHICLGMEVTLYFFCAYAYNSCYEIITNRMPEWQITEMGSDDIKSDFTKHHGWAAGNHAGGFLPY